YGTAYVAHPDWSPVAIGQDDVVVFLRLGELVVGRDREALVRSVDAALGGVGRGLTEHTADVFQRHAARLQLGRINLHPNRRFLLAGDDDLRNTGDLRNLLGDDRVGEIVDSCERQ